MECYRHDTGSLIGWHLHSFEPEIAIFFILMDQFMMFATRVDLLSPKIQRFFSPEKVSTQRAPIVYLALAFPVGGLVDGHLD